MKKKLLSAVVLCSLGIVGCGGDDNTNKPPVVPKFNTSDNIRNYLEGKKMLMDGTNIPTHPNGFDENLDLGPNSQCYNKVEMVVGAGAFQVSSTAGSLKDVNPTTKVGTCDNSQANGAPQVFTTNAVLIDKVKEDASCFDVLFTYTSFKQQGRGSLSADGKTLSLELFFEGRATGATCEAGGVGSGNIVHLGQPFTGNAVQVYTVSAQ
ncbi:hypothetical protein [Hyalangium rubrum]|uniref:Lipoprotein n=1 Tax=Hyalangium rubrum TaxID=3103134 RepID=A0ABU5GYV8_9BACT|nr:hypothetical protein [Hyalangium sp. s54d21]MDY7226368.1 hypothetical protein [Hyalangium sp. s54d21]